jgi:hypothetical protein
LLNSKIHRKNQRISVFLAASTIIIITCGWFLTKVIQSSEQFKINQFKADRLLFAKTVSHLHSQWMYENRPKKLKMVGFQVVGSDINRLEYLKEDEKVVELNILGWPELGSIDGQCKQLWFLMTNKAFYTKDLVTEKKDLLNTKLQGTSCRYIYLDRYYFEYRSESGSVSAIEVLDK